MTLADLAAYRPQRSEALCRPYRTWVVCAPNPPSGGLACSLVAERAGPPFLKVIEA